jgi:hypothetical protein
MASRDYEKLTARLSFYYRWLPLISRDYRVTIQEQLSTITTTPPIPPAKLDFLALALTIETPRKHQNQPIDAASLRMFNKPSVEGRHKVGLEYSVGGEDFVVHAGSEEESYEDAVESFVECMEAYGMAFLRQKERIEV